MDEVKYFDINQNEIEGQSFSKIEKDLFDLIIKKRKDLISQIKPNGENIHEIIYQIDYLSLQGVTATDINENKQLEHVVNLTEKGKDYFWKDHENFSEKIQYELSYSWTEDEVNLLLNACNQYCFNNQKHFFIPLDSLNTVDRKKDELREGVTGLVIKWIEDKVSKKEPIAEFIKQQLLWSPRLVNVKTDTAVNFLKKAKTNPDFQSVNFSSNLMLGILGSSEKEREFSSYFLSQTLNVKGTFEEVSEAINSLIFLARHDSLKENGAKEALHEIYTKRNEAFYRILIENYISEKDSKNNLSENESIDYDDYENGDPRISLRFGNISANYNIKYFSDSTFKVSKRNSSMEEKKISRLDKYGVFNYDKMRDVTNFLNELKNSKSYSKILLQLDIITLFSEKQQNTINKFLSYKIPNELLDPKNSIKTKKEFVKSNEQELNNLIEKFENGGVDLLIDLLNDSKEGIEIESKIENFGYKDLNTNDLDLFLEVYNNPLDNTETKMFSFYFYAYIRKKLPDELVKEFERKTSLKFPSELESIESVKDFHLIEDNESDILVKSFDSVVKDKENLEWLYSELTKLRNKIRENNKRPEYVPLRDFMIDSAIPEEKITEQFLENYQSLLDLKIRSKIESKIGFSISLLDVPAQIAFIEFLSRTKEVEFDDFCSFINKYEESDRVAICSCYLAFKSRVYDNVIENVSLSEELGLPLVRHVSKLIGNAQKIKDFLQQEFKTSYEKRSIAHIHEKLIKLAFNLLLKHSALIECVRIAKQIEKGEVDIDVYEEFRTSFTKGVNILPPLQFLNGVASYKETLNLAVKKVEEDCNAELFSQTLFINSFKTLHESGTEFSLEDIESSKFEQSEGGTITETDISAMRSIYSHNQKESAVHDALLTSFDKKVKDPKTRFNIFKWQDKIQSFVAFSNKGDSLYMSAFNVSPDARGYKIGEAMLDQVVEQEAKESTLTADCDSKLPISAKYIETGWVGTFYWEDKNEKEQKSDWVLDIKRDETANNSYWGKSQNKESIITQRTHPENVKVEVAKTQAELPFQLCTKGFVLTRMFKDEGSGLYYGVFELPNKKETTHE